MKRKNSFIISILLCVFLFAGCSSQNIQITTENSQNKTIITETHEVGLFSETDVSETQETDSFSEIVSSKTNVDLPIDLSQIDLSVDISYSEKTLTFYRISRDMFLDFLDKPSTAILTASETKKESVLRGDRYNRGSEVFFTGVGSVSHLSTPEGASAYLKTMNVEETAKHIFWFDVPGEPIFAWIVGEGCNYVVSFEFNYETREKDAVLRTFEEFRQLHRAVFATITINGNPTQGDQKAILYHNYADIPLLSTLKSIGAVITEQNDGICKLKFENATYTLNLDAPSMIRDNVGSDFLNECSGFVFLYRSVDDLFVDTSTLSCVGNGMNISIQTELDRNREVVNITVRS